MGNINLKEINLDTVQNKTETPIKIEEEKKSQQDVVDFKQEFCNIIENEKFDLNSDNSYRSLLISETEGTCVELKNARANLAKQQANRLINFEQPIKNCLECDENASYICKFCEKLYHTRQHYKKHLRMLINSDVKKLQENNNSDKIKKRVCEICGKTFNILKHTFLCKSCRGKLLNSYNTKKHKFECEYCDKTFISLKSFGKHQHEHGVIRTCQCMNCQNLLKNKDIINHTSDKKNDPTFFHCKICDKVFGTRKNRNMHMLVHTNQKKEICEICKKQICITKDLNKNKN